MELGHHLLVVQLISFLEYTHIISEEVLIEYCTILHREQLLVASHPLCKTEHSVSLMFKFGHCFGMLLKPRLNTSGSMCVGKL